MHFIYFILLLPSVIFAGGGYLDNECSHHLTCRDCIGASNPCVFFLLTNNTLFCGIVNEFAVGELKFMARRSASCATLNRLFNREASTTTSSSSSSTAATTSSSSSSTETTLASQVTITVTTATATPLSTTNKYDNFPASATIIIISEDASSHENQVPLQPPPTAEQTNGIPSMSESRVAAGAEPDESNDPVLATTFPQESITTPFSGRVEASEELEPRNSSLDDGAGHVSLLPTTPASTAFTVPEFGVLAEAGSKAGDTPHRRAPSSLFSSSSADVSPFSSITSASSSTTEDDKRLVTTSPYLSSLEDGESLVSTSSTTTTTATSSPLEDNDEVPVVSAGKNDTAPLSSFTSSESRHDNYRALTKRDEFTAHQEEGAKLIHYSFHSDTDNSTKLISGEHSYLPPSPTGRKVYSPLARVGEVYFAPPLYIRSTSNKFIKADPQTDGWDTTPLPTPPSDNMTTKQPVTPQTDGSSSDHHDDDHDDREIAGNVTSPEATHTEATVVVVVVVTSNFTLPQPPPLPKHLFPAVASGDVTSFAPPHNVSMTTTTKIPPSIYHAPQSDSSSTVNRAASVQNSVNVNNLASVIFTSSLLIVILLLLLQHAFKKPEKITTNQV